MRYAQENPVDHPISTRDMEGAIKLGHVLTSHALAAFDLVQNSGVNQDAIEICKWIRINGHRSFSCRECQRRFRRLKKDDLGPVFKILIEENIVKEAKVKSDKGNDIDGFIVNPLFK